MILPALRGRERRTRNGDRYRAMRRPENRSSILRPVLACQIKAAGCPNDIARKDASTVMRILISLAAAIAFVAMPGNVAAQTPKQRPKCAALQPLKPKADAIRAAMRNLSYSSLELNNCRNALRIATDHRALMLEAGEACVREDPHISWFQANEGLFGDFFFDTSSFNKLVLACEKAGVIPLRTSQAACPALADYENEALKFQREAFRPWGTEESREECRAAASYNRRFEALNQSFYRARGECRTAADTPLPATHMVTVNPALVCLESKSGGESWFSADDFRRWFGGTTIIIPVGLIIGLLILVIGLMRRR